MGIEKITIVGGGSAGWMTAATLIKAFPKKEISVIEPKDIPRIGVGESTLGGIKHWAKYIGIDETDFFKHTDASYKLSIKFTDFYKKDFGSFHYPFGFPMTFDDKNPYSIWHLKKYFYPETDVQDFVRCLFPASYLFENNKFSLNKYGEFDNFNPNLDAAYHFDSIKFGNWLRDVYCIPRGVSFIQGSVESVSTFEDGIEFLTLDNKEKIYSDLFIDCTGFTALLIDKHLNEPFESLEDMLPNNKAWATRLPYENKEKELEGFTNCTAIGNGWCWNIPLWSRLGTGYVYSDKYINSEEALEEFKQYLMSNKMVVPRTRKQVDALEYKEIKMRVGIHKRTFVKNVVAIGLSAGFIEPLESNGLFSVHEFLFKLVDILQRGDISQFDRDMYNTSVYDLFMGFAKFVTLHYALSHREDTKYWRYIKNKSLLKDYNNKYFTYYGRTDGFYNLTWRYMDEWGHPLGERFNNPGITFISTGMNLFMMNDYRVQNLKLRTGLNIEEELSNIMKVWEERKIKWESNARSCITLNKYLENVFYTQSE